MLQGFGLPSIHPEWIFTITGRGWVGHSGTVVVPPATWTEKASGSKNPLSSAC